jgi:hypothetical protein
LPCLTDALSEARASPFQLPSSKDMEVRAEMGARVSLGVVASEDLSPGSAERDSAVPHGRTVKGASQSVLARIKQGDGGTRREGGSREPRRRRV